MVAISCEDRVAQDSMEVAYGRIMDLCGIEVIVRVCTVVGEAMPKVERFFSKIVGHTEVGTFIGAEVKQSPESVLRELVFGTEDAEPRNTRKLVGWTIWSYVAKRAEELKGEVLVRGLGLATEIP